MKLSTQMAPVGMADAKEVKLDLKHNHEWRKAGTAVIDPLSRTDLFRTEVPAGAVASTGDSSCPRLSSREK